MKRKLILKIGGMTCDGCATTIKSFVDKVDGVLSASVNLKKSGEIIYESDKVSKDAIVQNEIFFGQYSAEIIKDEPVEE